VSAPRYETIAAICVIGLCEVTALVMGVDGILLTATVGTLAALGGFRFAQHRERVKKGL
jgi:hypothetical protein